MSARGGRGAVVKRRVRTGRRGLLCRDRLFDRLFEAAPLGLTGQHGVLLAAAEDEELCPARGTRLVDRLLPQLEVALDVGRVVGAAIKAAAATTARLDLDDVPS